MSCFKTINFHNTKVLQQKHASAVQKRTESLKMSGDSFLLETCLGFIVGEPDNINGSEPIPVPSSITSSF